MNRRTPEEARRIAESLGPAERLVQLIINFPDHLWHETRKASKFFEHLTGQAVFTL